MNTSYRNRSSGFALIITLSFVVLITALVVAYLFRTQTQRQVSFSSVSQAKAKELALSSVDIIISELRQEIANGSQIYSSGTGSGTPVTPANISSATPPLIFYPSTPQNMVPSARGDTPAPDATWINVIKRSVPTTADTVSPYALYSGTGIPARALIAQSPSASTANASFNGRSIDDTAWRAPQLIPSTGTLSTYWCYVTRAGPESVADSDVAGGKNLKSASSANYAIGRFAYIIYDVGGLLDINAAGNSLQSTGTFNATRREINQVDLTQIPFLLSSGSFLSWRSPVSGTNPTLLLSGSNYLQNIQQGDQLFTSRQELINYSNANPSIISGSALPSLTVFSRELNAPSWAPQNPVTSSGTVTTGSYAYNTNENTSTSYNRFIPNVRSPGGTITSYLSSGTSFTYTIPAGAPLIQRRFPLNRLQWLTGTGAANGGTAASIQACFGLMWNSSNSRWQYVGPTGSTVQTSIETLEQVASEATPREPNFFELMRAGILAGSLGLTSGTTTIYPNPIYSNPDNQVAQIVANTIDQYNSDSYPKTVYFNNNAFTGSENIPYINKIDISGYRPENPATYDGYARGNFRAWLEFEMWNPYQGPVNQQPGSFQIVISGGGAEVDCGYDFLGSGTLTDADVIYTTPPLISGTLTVAGPNLSGSTQNPMLLNSLRQGGATVTVASSSPGDEGYDIFTADGNAASYTGFWLGDLPVGIMDATGSYESQPLFPPVGPSALRPHFNGVVYSLQYNCNYGSGPTNWVTVQTGTLELSTNIAVDAPNMDAYLTPYNTTAPWAPPDLALRYIMLEPVDPRTSRFGLQLVGDILTGSSETSSYSANATYFFNASSGVAGTDWQWNMTFYPTMSNFVPPFGGFGVSPGVDGFRYADNSGTGSTTAPMYTDPDGVQRYGDSVWAGSFPWSTGTNGSYPTLPMTSGSQTRPVMLHRSFQSVAELGYVFRDLPFKTLDFWTANSADAGLLDLFCVDDSGTTSSVVAGKVNLNTQHPEVLEALLSGVTRTALSPASYQLSGTDQATVAQALVALTGTWAPAVTGTGTPMVNKSELATRLAPNCGLTSSGTFMNVPKIGREAVVRGLADIGQTRTWNLLIDVVAQVGRFPSSATTLDKFNVEGEKRYWVHVAIDRFTGEIVDQQFEPVVDQIVTTQ